MESTFFVLFFVARTEKMFQLYKWWWSDSFFSVEWRELFPKTFYFCKWMQVENGVGKKNMIRLFWLLWVSIKHYIWWSVLWFSTTTKKKFQMESIDMIKPWGIIITEIILIYTHSHTIGFISPWYMMWNNNNNNSSRKKRAFCC